MWRSPVARAVRDGEAAGSNPVTPTIRVTMKTIQREIVSAFIFSRDDLLVLGQGQKGSVYENTWMVPGGGIKKPETPSEALLREVMEETGIDITGARIDRLAGEPTGQNKRFVKRIGELALVRMRFHPFMVRLDASAANTPVVSGDDFTSAQWVHPSQFETMRLSPLTEKYLRELGLLAIADA